MRSGLRLNRGYHIAGVHIGIITILEMMEDRIHVKTYISNIISILRSCPFLPLSVISYEKRKLGCLIRRGFMAQLEPTCSHPSLPKHYEQS